jgi:class 3 adenylate cyclase
VLFTDIAGSTERQSEVGDERFDDIRHAHFAVLRNALAAHQGTEVKNLGDGLMVVFRAASNAIAAAVAMQVECDRQGRRDPELAIGVKIGVSIGDVSREDDDWFGSPVVEAARLCAACKAGQLLVTETIRLMAGSRTRERIERVGELSLKGLPDPVAVCEVHWEPVPLAASVPLPGLFVGAVGLPFAGRATERELLDKAWHAALAGERNVVLIAGEPGIGKTRLVGELAHQAHSDGATVLVGRSDDEIDVPFRPFAEALDQLCRHAETEVLAEHVSEVGGVVARIAPALARRTAVDDQPVIDSDAERVQLFHGVADLLRRQAARSPVLLVLDDLHWADRSSLLLLRDLVRRLGDVPVMVVGTYRDTDLDRAHPLAAMLADFRREPGVVRMALSGLTQDDVLEYLVLAGGHELDADAVDLGRQIAVVTSGNPFFVGETLRHLAESGAIVHRDGRWRRGTLDADAVGVPEGVREVVGRRLSALGSDVERLLSIAAVAGAEFDGTVVAGVAGVSEGVAVELLDRAAARTIVVEDGERFGWYRFAHALVRQTLLEELSTTRRLRIHRTLAEETEKVAPDRIEEIAHHYLEAAATGVGEQAVRYGALAARAASDRLAFEQSIRWTRRALEAEEGLPPDPARRSSLLIELAEAGNWTDDVFLLGPEVLEAAELARAAGRPDLLASAAYWYLGPVGMMANLADPNLRPLLEEAKAALDSCPDVDFTVERLRVAGKLSHSHLFDADPSARLALSEEVLELGHQVEVPLDRWAAVAWRIGALDGLARYDEWERRIDESSRLANELSAPIQRDALVWELLAARSRGDVDAVARHVERHIERFDPLGLVIPGVAYGARAVRAIDEGRFSDVWPLIDDYRDRASQAYDASHLALAALEAWPAIWTADAEAYRRLLDRLPESTSGFVAIYPLRVMLAILEEGDEAARAVYDDWRPMLAFAPANFAVHVFTVATYPAWRFGDRETADRLLAGLRPHAGRWPTVGPAVPLGPADLHIGVNLLTLGEFVAAEFELRAALAECERTGASAWGTVALFHLAEALDKQERTADAAATVTRCQIEAERLGMTLVLHDLERLGLPSADPQG